jgi:predicted DNA-binding transcriptional regulator AlpA
MAKQKEVFVELRDENEVAELFGVSVATVRRWRLLKQGPQFLKLGASVRYRDEDLLRWLESRPRGGEVVTQ